MSTKLVKKDSEFAEVLGIIQAGRAKAYKVVNVALIDTYWAVGAHLSGRMAEGGWGKGIVRELSEWLLRQAPDLKGFSASNLWRMKQFYEVYADQPKLAPLVRVLPQDATGVLKDSPDGVWAIGEAGNSPDAVWRIFETRPEHAKG